MGRPTSRSARSGKPNSSTAQPFAYSRLPSGSVTSTAASICPRTVSAGRNAARPLFSRRLTGRSPGYVWPLLAVMVITTAVIFMLTAVQRHYLLRMETRSGLVTGARFFRHLLA